MQLFSKNLCLVSSKTNATHVVTVNSKPKNICGPFLWNYHNVRNGVWVVGVCVDCSEDNEAHSDPFVCLYKGTVSVWALQKIPSCKQLYVNGIGKVHGLHVTYESFWKSSPVTCGSFHFYNSFDLKHHFLVTKRPKHAENVTFSKIPVFLGGQDLIQLRSRNVKWVKKNWWILYRRSASAYFIICFLCTWVALLESCN